MTIIEHIRLRTGMYMPTNANLPTKEAWDVLLLELVADGVRAFTRGAASRIEIRFNPETGCISIGHDGPQAKTLDRIAKALDSGSSGGCLDDEEERREQEAFPSRYGDLKYALINALSLKVTVETYVGGKWRAVKCLNGNVGPIEVLMPGLIEPGIDRFFHFAYAVDPQFLSEDSAPTPYSEEELQELGETLAWEHPGLRVVVNNQEHFSRHGVEALVSKWIGECGGDVLMVPATSRCGGVTVTCGATRRNGLGRRIVGRAFLNGREVKSSTLLTEVSRMVCDWICSCRDFQTCGYDFHWVVSGHIPMDDKMLQWVCDIVFDRFSDNAHPLTVQCLARVKRCLVDAFADMPKGQ